jgi:hypothetical protein
MKMSELVAKYIELRDKKAEHKAEYDEKVSKIEETLTKIEAKILEVFETTGMDSVKTECGTAYSTLRTSCSVADKEAFISFVREKDEWPLLEVRPSKSAVDQYRSAMDELPPGISWRAERVVNIRRT